jgi:hypothetical protein
MWSIEKVGAGSSRGRQVTLRPPIFQSSEGLRGRRTSHLGLIGGLFLSGFCEEFRPFLTGSAPQTEIDVTLSKQTTEKFLTGARTAFSRHQLCRDSRSNCTHGTRVAGHGSRLPPATSLLLALTKEGPLATAFRYNAPCPNLSREARNLN